MVVRGSVLVVEDDPSLRELYVDILTDDAWDVRQAEDGLEALELLRAGPRPCVVIVDLRMPRMDGWELSTHLHALGLPFIVVAAHYQIQQEAASLGARWWLQKPVAVDRLLDVIREACGTPAAA